LPKLYEKCIKSFSCKRHSMSELGANFTSKIVSLFFFIASQSTHFVFWFFRFPSYDDDSCKHGVFSLNLISHNHTTSVTTEKVYTAMMMIIIPLRLKIKLWALSFFVHATLCVCAAMSVGICQLNYIAEDYPHS
jgi:hypothetical protein